MTSKREREIKERGEWLASMFSKRSKKILEEHRQRAKRIQKRIPRSLRKK